MKIEKGHYVPKELITSEAIHEAVVKCFVAAGFIDDRPEYGDYESISGTGLCVSDSGRFIWGGTFNCVKPLTLQQLFTAKNGLQWPDWAERISVSGKVVAFEGLDFAQAIVGSLVDAGDFVGILATRQPKEKEVKEALDKAVIGLKGKWPTSDCSYMQSFISEKEYGLNNYNAEGTFCNRDQFTQRSKELGFINGYRWGVEYQTNGKRPDLADDVVVHVSAKIIKGSSCFYIYEVASVDWPYSSSFKITDQRYKPADTSYLNQCEYKGVAGIDQSKVESMSVLGVMHAKTTDTTIEFETVKVDGNFAFDSNGDWYDYENQKALRFPDVGSECEIGWNGSESHEWYKGVVAYRSEKYTVIVYDDGKETCYRKNELIYVKFRPLDHATRKAELEKNMVVNNAFDECDVGDSIMKNLNRLYDAGYLRLPINKSISKEEFIKAAESIPAFKRDSALDYVPFIAGHLFDAGFTAPAKGE